MNEVNPKFKKIYTIEDLQNINKDLKVNYILMNNLDAKCTHEWNSGKGFDPIGNQGVGYNEFYFTGIFDGQGYTISNLYIYRPSEDFVGLFSGVGDGSYTGGGNGGMVKNLILSNPTITGLSEVGGIVGNPDALATCEDCAVVGGTITGIGTQHIGGFVGSGCNSHFTRCSSSATVVGLTASEVGGFTGDGVSGTFKDCYSSGNVTGQSKVGGFCGKATGFFSRCFSIGTPKGKIPFIGGFGGFANGSYNDCFWDIDTSGMKTNYGGAIGKTTKEMMHKKTFTNFDFKFVWYIIDGKTYPKLRKKK